MSNYNGTGHSSLQLNLWGNEGDVERDNLTQIVIPCSTFEDCHPLDIKVMLDSILNAHGFEGSFHTSASEVGWYAIVIFRSEWASENIEMSPMLDHTLKCVQSTKSLHNVKHHDMQRIMQMTQQTGVYIEPTRVGKIEWALSTVHPKHPIRQTNEHWKKTMFKLETFCMLAEIEAILVEIYGTYPHRYLCGDRKRISEFISCKSRAI